MLADRIWRGHSLAAYVKCCHQNNLNFSAITCIAPKDAHHAPTA